MHSLKLTSNHSVVNGSWSQWSRWQPCSVTCGEGNRTRTRTCSNPPPNWKGKDCPGTNTYTESCNWHKCEGRCPFLKVFFPKMIYALVSFLLFISELNQFFLLQDIFCCTVVAMTTYFLWPAFLKDGKMAHAAKGQTSDI